MAKRCLSLLFLHAILLINACLFVRSHARHHKHTLRRNKRDNCSPTPQPDDPADAPEAAPSGFFDVTKFGAVGDGIVDDTAAFKAAWDAACSNTDNSEFSVLYAPSGHTFMIQATMFTGPCDTEIIFKIDGSVVPPDGPEEWPKNISKHQWLVFYKIDGMSLQGGGRIDGRGQKWWELPCKPHRGPNGTTLPGPCVSPIAIRFFHSSNLTVKELKIMNSPQFHFRFDVCHNVHVESLHITAPQLSPNTDGIHIENTDNVRIHNSYIFNGDDCISIGAGCYDVDIRNISCGHGHGISIGSLGNHNSRACVHNITVKDCFFKETSNGVRIKTWQGGSGAVSGVTYDNLRMETVRNPIIIDQYYCLEQGCNNQSSAVLVTDIVYSSLKGTYDVRSPPMHFGCSDTIPCSNITLSDIELLPAIGEMVSDPFCWNAYGSLDSLTIPPVSCFQEGLPPQSILESGVDSC
ncbi:hypothetical protein RDABS01_018429 [Bienertia sinuspersici]